MLWRLFAFAAVLWGSTVAPTAADVLIRIDKAMQQMTVASGGKTLHVWPVSTGRAGYVTPNGNFRPQWMARRWFSRRYHGSPMPYSIFYHKGYAIHGTTYLRQLGAPASHGCVRLHPQ
jgi:lipoprotein-anchoring transpeptidase ErfK/SrfK